MREAGELERKKKLRKKEEKPEREREKERKKVIESLGAIFLPHLERTFPLSEPLNRQ